MRDARLAAQRVRPCGRDDVGADMAHLMLASIIVVAMWQSGDGRLAALAARSCELWMDSRGPLARQGQRHMEETR